MTNPEAVGDWINPGHFDAYMSSVGNHEAKLLTAGLLLHNPEKSYARLDISRELISHQGENVGWAPAPLIGYQYCRDSLEPIGAVVKEDIKNAKGKIVPGYRANDENLEFNIAAGDTILGWSLENPDTSIQRLLGGTSSTSEVRAPATRYRILSELLNAERPYTSFELADKLSDAGYSRTNVSIGVHLRAMEAHGILKTNSKYHENDPQIRIVNTAFKHIAMTYESLTPPTRAIYDIVADAYDKSDTYRMSELIAMVEAKYPDMNLNAVRHRLVRVGYNSRESHLPGLEFVDQEAKEAKKTRIVLESSLAPVVGSLLTSLEVVRSGGIIEKYDNTTRQIIDSPELFASVMKKAKEFSPFAAHRTGVSKRAGEIVLTAIGRATEPQTVKQMQTFLKEEFNRELDTNTIRNLLNNLVVKGLINRAETEPTAGRTKKLATYTLAEVPSQTQYTN